MDLPVDQMTRVRASERDQSWPDKIVISAHFGKKTKSIEIGRDEFFGFGQFGAPISGQALIFKIEQLRKMK